MDLTMTANTRLFVFGCSFTKWHTATWADYLAPKFDEYHNFGQGGASNLFMLHRFLEANDRFKFHGSQDHIMIMLTGFDRFSWLAADGQDWHTHGDLSTWADSDDARKHYPAAQGFVKHLWSPRMAVEQTWMAATTMKQLLVSLGCQHQLLMALDNSHYVQQPELLGLNHQCQQHAQAVYDLLDIAEPFDLFRQRQGLWSRQHPSPEVHLQFVQEKFPELMSTKSGTRYSSTQ
jgi:hypothetical protein